MSKDKNMKDYSSAVPGEQSAPTQAGGTQWIDIGDDHAIAFVDYGGDPRAVIEYQHKRPDGSACQGKITPTGSAWAKAFGDAIPTWDVLNWEPLTCSPSLLCRACGDHGYIQGGKWVRA